MKDGGGSCFIWGFRNSKGGSDAIKFVPVSGKKLF